MLLLELNRLLRPGGYFVWSATPVYQKHPEDVGIWEGKIYVFVCMIEIDMEKNNYCSQKSEKAL